MRRKAGLGELAPSTPEISIVIPAYNEADRLPATLSRIEEYLRCRSLDAEVIVVDDGSRDGTADLVRAHAVRSPRLKLISACRHAGKGRAVRLGMASASGKWRVFTDADLSVPIDELDKLLLRLQDGVAVAIASRGLPASEIQEHQPWYREAMGKTFNRLVCLVLMRGIRDTQCGFKAFTAKAAQQLFPPLQTQGFGFDVEVLYRARLAGFKIAEIPTRWINSPQSRVRPIRHSLAMFLELLAIRGRVKRYPT